MIKNAVREKLLKNSKVEATILSESRLFLQKELVSTPVPMLNVALSGQFDGGLLAGLLTIAGDSKHFKSGFGLLLMASFQQKYPDATVLFYDSEHGIKEAYFKAFNINTEHVIHKGITNIEQLKTDLAQTLDALEFSEDPKDQVLIFIDSLGNLPSIKEVEDAIADKQVADMTRAKQIKSLYRIVTPHLQPKNIPMIVVNHVYKELGLYPKTIVSGGSGVYLSANDVWIIGRQQDKDGKELQGWNFVINVDKSRTVKEKSKFPINITFENGIDQYSGLLENAVEAGIIISNAGWYVYDEQKFRRDGLDAVFEKLLKDNSFQEFVRNKYQLSDAPIIANK
jgi:RecA/RadA recombinase